MRTNIENAILSAFLFTPFPKEEENDVYELNTSIFKTEFRKKVAIRINDTDPYAYGFLSYQIEESCAGTKYEQDFLDICEQTPMLIKQSKLYHDKLVADDRMEELL